MAAESRRPSQLPASDPDLERRSGSDDADLVVPADTFDISALRPGWKRANESPSPNLPAANPLLVFAPPAPVVPPAAVPPSKAQAVPPTDADRQWRVIRRRGPIAAATIVLAVVIALPWLLLWNGDGGAVDRASHQGVRPPSPPAARQVLSAAVIIPMEHGLTAPPRVKSRVPAGVRPARPMESERPAPTPVAYTRAPRAKDSSAASAPPPRPPDAPTVPAERVAPAISATTPEPAPRDGAPRPGAAGSEPPAATPATVAAPSPAIAAAPSPVVPTAATDERLVAATLRRFAHAYEQLDANAVAEVWPQADRRVLTRAFDSIASQEVYFEKCDVRISESGATASCGGWLTYVPKVGKKDPRSISRQWDFALHKGAGEWRITTAAVR